MQVGFVRAGGTSAWAYDGSGRVVRDKYNYGRCRFRSGKEYDCDLSASYNIAARWYARAAERTRLAATGAKSSPAGGKTGWPAHGGRSGASGAPAAGPRMPVTLSSLWAKEPTEPQLRNPGYSRAAA